MRSKKKFFIRMICAFLTLGGLFSATAYADTTVTLEQPVHFTTAEGSDVVLGPGA